MLIEKDFTVEQPVERVWEFFGDIPQVARCLPGTELTDDLGDDRYRGNVGIRMGPVRLQFAGLATIVERDDATHRMVIDASGSDQRGRGNAAMMLTAVLTPAGRGTRVAISQDLQLSGAAAQYGRGMVSDVTSVLMGQFATNMQTRIAALERGEDLAAFDGARPASGLAIGLQAMRMALGRVFRRFFLPYRSPSTSAYTTGGH